MNNPNPRAIVETFSGKQIDLINPNPKQICIHDIAKHLARINRFNGATTSPDEKVSVAAHSLFVCIYIFKQTNSHLLALHGLLHDAHEAYIGDITRPVKMLPGMNELLKTYSEPLQKTILESLGVPEIDEDQHSVIKFADNASLAFEARHFMHSKGKGWGLDDYLNGADLAADMGWNYRYSEKSESAIFVQWFEVLKNSIIN